MTGAVLLKTVAYLNCVYQSMKSGCLYKLFELFDNSEFHTGNVLECKGKLYQNSAVA